MNYRAVCLTNTKSQAVAQDCLQHLRDRLCYPRTGVRPFGLAVKPEHGTYRIVCTAPATTGELEQLSSAAAAYVAAAEKIIAPYMQN